MKLYLSSYGLGNHPEKLQALMGENKKVAVILNAQDLYDVTERQIRVDRGFEEMREIGMRPEELDLRDYFSKSPADLSKKLQEYGALWIRGGNVFVLARAMKQSGFSECIGDLVRSEKLVYAGFSAGSCTAAPNLHGLELVDDAHAIPEGYDPEIVWEGLGFVPYTIAPHYHSDHPESADIDKVVGYLEEHSIPHKKLHDGQAIVIDGDHEEIAG